MRRFLSLVVAALFLTIGTAAAQEKGEMYIGGNLGLGISASSYDTSSFSSNFGISISPEFGYFAAKKFRVGAAIGYSYSSDVHTFLVSPNVAYYITLADKLYYTPEISLHAGLGSSGGYTAGAVGVGVNLFKLEFRPTHRFAMAVSLIDFSYVYMSRMNSLSFNLLGSSSVSLRYYF